MDTSVITIQVKDLFLTEMSREEGLIFRSFIEQLWDQCDRIILDFQEVTFLSVSFLDEAIAKLFLYRKPSEITLKLLLVNMSSDDKRLLNGISSSRIKQNEQKIKEADVNTN